jgi:hypothetical protein
MLMLWAVLLFGVAAVFGLTMALLHAWTHKLPPVVLPLLHGVFVISGFSVLLGAVWPDFVGRATVALAVFGLAALGGLTLAIGRHARGKSLPSPLLLGHGGAAVIAFAILLTAVLGA